MTSAACSACKRVATSLRSGWRAANTSSTMTSSISRSRLLRSSTAIIMRGSMRHLGWNIRAYRSIRRNSILLGASSSPTRSTSTSTWTPTCLSFQSIPISTKQLSTTCSFTTMSNSTTLTTTRTSRTWQTGSARSSSRNRTKRRTRCSYSLRWMTRSSTRWRSRTSCGSSLLWTTLALACHSDIWRRPSRRPRIARRLRSWLASMMPSSASTRMS